MAFIIYDTETTGTNTAFDQVVQFAAVRTDDELNELDSFEIWSRLLPCVAPSPVAMWVNGITVPQLTDETLPSHYEMVRRIRARLVDWSPAVFIGFNSIQFDEHMLRGAFYKTLHPLYLTNTNGNVRCDAMRLVQAASVFTPNAIVLPRTEADRRIYRLDQIAPANGFDHDKAHDALSDVRATLHLCRLLRERAPDFWLSTVRLCRKAAVLDFVATQPIFGLVDFYWGRCYAWAVSMIGHNDQKSNDLFVYNLAVDPRALAGLGEPGLRLRVGQRPKPVRRIRANAVPIISPIEQAPKFAEGLALGADELNRRAALLQTNAGLRARLISAYEASREAREPSPHIEEQIYDTFVGDADHRLMDAFHQAPWEERLPIIDRFEDTRLRELGYRLIHIERPDLLDENTRQQHSDRIARNLLGLDGKVPWLTLREAIQEANNLLGRGTALPHILEHREFLQRRLAEAMRLTL